MNRSASEEQIIEMIKERGINYSEYEFKLDFPNAPNPFSYYLRKAGRSLKEEAKKEFQKSKYDYYNLIIVFIIFCALTVYAVIYYGNLGRVLEGIPIYIMFVILDALFVVAIRRTKKEQEINKLFQAEDAILPRLKVRGKTFKPLAKRKDEGSGFIESTPVSIVIFLTLGFSITSAILIFIGKWVNPPAGVIVAIIACFLVGGLLIYARAG